MNVTLSKQDYDFLIDVASDMFLEAPNHEIVGETVIFSFKDETDWQNFLTDYNFSIVHFGMDNQDTVNEIGIAMYRIYDDWLHEVAINRK